MSFGGVLVIANGDTNQLPTITGSDIFLSPIIIFTFECHFLKHFVRMHEANGKRLLELMSQKPIPPDDITIITSLLSKHCSFVNNWIDVHDASVMKVFGKKEAEREAIFYYQQQQIRNGVNCIEFISQDEMCAEFSNTWKPATQKVVDFLNRVTRLFCQKLD